MLQRLKIMGLIGVVLLSSSTVQADNGQQFIPVETAVTQLADGTPWAAFSSNGRKFTLTMTADGNGKITGALPWSVSLNWTIKENALCLDTAMMSKCLKFTEVPEGFQGWKDNEQDLKLIRASN